MRAIIVDNWTGFYLWVYSDDEEQAYIVTSLSSKYEESISPLTKVAVIPLE